jgi:hypothetical protein
MKKKIHINQHVIRSNKKNGTNDPVITVKTSKSNTYANEVEIFGKSKLVYSPIKPLPVKSLASSISKLYEGKNIKELAARGLQLDACCLGLDACRLHLESL